MTDAAGSRLPPGLVDGVNPSTPAGGCGIHLIATDAPVDVGDPDGRASRGRLGDLLLLITGRTDPARSTGSTAKALLAFRSIPRPSGGTR